MSGFEDLRPRAEAIISGAKPEEAPPIPDSLVSSQSNVESFNNLSSFAFKIAVGLRIAGRRPVVTIQQLVIPEGLGKSAAEWIQTNSGWVIDFTYKRYEYSYVLEEFSPIGTFLDQGGELFHFNGLRDTDRSDTVPEPLSIDPSPKIEGAFRTYSHADMDRAVELMTSLAVFAIRENVDIG